MRPMSIRSRRVPKCERSGNGARLLREEGGFRMTGACFCGAIRYRVEQAFTKVRACHCSRCRRAFSGAGSAVGWVASGAHSWTAGEDRLQSFVNAEGFGLGFCGQCGSTLCGIADGGVAMVTLGTLDGDPDLRIEEDIYVGSKARWDCLCETANAFSEGPDSPRILDLGAVPRT